MSSVKIAYGSATSLSSASNLDSATSASYPNLGTIDNTTNLYLDYLVEIEFTPSATPTGNTQIVLFAIDSVDGTNYSDTSADANMAFLGAVQTNGTTAVRSKAFSVAAAFGGNLPPAVQIIAKIDDGVALAATGNSAQYRGVYQTVA